MGINTGNFSPRIVPHLPAECMRHRLGMVIRNFIFNPESKGVLQSDLLTTSNCNQTVVKIICQTDLGIGPRLCV